MITTITATGLKGRNFTHSLSPITLITGGNNTGKTTVLDAVKLALLGHVPGIGKTNAATADLMSGSQMFVSAEINGQSVSRTWKRTGSKVTTTKTGCGEMRETPIVSLDAADYFSRTPKQQAELVFSLMGFGAEVFDETKLRAKIESAIATEAPEQVQKTKAAERAIQRVSRGELSPDEWLRELLETIDAEIKNGTAAAKAMRGTIEGIERLRATEAPVRVDEIEAISENETALRGFAETAATLREKIRQRDASRVRAEKLRARIAELNAVPEVQETVDALKLLRDAKKDRIASLQLWKGEHNSGLAKRRARVEFVKTEIEKLRTELAKITAKHERDMVANECPCCGVSGELFKPVMQKRFDEKVAEIERAIFDAEESIRNSEIVIRQEEQTVKNYEQGITICEAELAENEKKLDAKAAAERRDGMREELSAMTLDDANVDVELRAANAGIAMHKTALEQLAGQRKAAQAQLADERRLEQARIEYDAEVCSVDKFKAAREVVFAERERLIEIGFGPLLKTLNQFTDGIIPTPLQFRDGEIGREENGAWISIRTFGGTHSAVVYAGLNAALGATSESRIVLVDEMGRFDKTNKQRFIRNVAKAIASGMVEQFIGIDVEPAAYEKLQAETGLAILRKEA